jgi:hypothetical protein
LKSFGLGILEDSVAFGNGFMDGHGLVAASKTSNGFLLDQQITKSRLNALRDTEFGNCTINS